MNHDNDLPEFEEDDFWDDDGSFFAVEGKLTDVPWVCARCGTLNETQVDPSAGFTQEYVEDCELCCNPNVIRIQIDQDSMLISLQNELEYD